MTALEAYKKFLLKINKNDTNRNIHIGIGEFVLVFNEQKNVWLGKELSEDSDTSEKNELAELLVHDLEVLKLGDTERYAEFAIPEDLFKYESSFSIADREPCKGRILYNWDFKPSNKNVLLQDENNNPSFDYEQTIVNLSGQKILVFKTDFEIVRQYITYYKEVDEIDIAGYVKIDGQPSVTIDPNLSDVLVNEIINYCAEEVVRNYTDLEQLQVAKDRTKEK